MFSFIKEKVKKLYTGFTHKMSSLFSERKLDDALIEDLSDLLLSADTGVKTTNSIIERLSQYQASHGGQDAEEAKKQLEKILLEIFEQAPVPELLPKVLLMVGINGSGKTTFVAKLAHKLKQSGKRVMVVAGDTFRAAATQQLAEWGKVVSVEVFIGKDGQDPASVIFDACKKFKEEQFDNLIIDTAGRLQTKVNLMRELEKIRNVIGRFLAHENIATWLTVDAMLGQNSLRQAEMFHEVAALNGIVLTKLDGTGKGGIVFSIVDTLRLPIVYVSFGEKLEEFKVFDAQEYVYGLLHE